MRDVIKSLRGRRMRAAALVWVLCLALTWLAWSWQRSQALKIAAQEFSLHVDHVMEGIKDRLHQNEQILLRGASLFDDGAKVSRTDWRNYVKRQHLGNNDPGIQSLGFSQVVRSAGLAAHIGAVQSAPTVYLEPAAGQNWAASGLDMLSDPARAQAMQRAAETGKTAITGKVVLAQDTPRDAQPDFFMFVPVYNTLPPQAAAGERWGAIKGFVYSPYRVSDLMRSMREERLGVLGFAIFDGAAENEDTRLYATPKAQPTAVQPAPPRLTAVRALDVFGQTWMVRFQSQPGFDAGFDSALTGVAAVLGGGLSGLLFLLVGFLVFRRDQAQALATQVAGELQTLHTRRLQESEAAAQSMRTTLYERSRHQQAVNAHAIVSVANAAGNITYVNDKFCKVSGYSRDELLGHNHRLLKSDVHTPEFYDVIWRTISRGEIWSGEICNHARDGSLYWVESSIVPFVDARGKPYQYISIRTDITQLKRNEEALRTSEERLRRGQAFANIGTWDWHIGSGELFWSERIGPLFGYAEGMLETCYNNFIQAIHPDDRQAVLLATSACLERGVPYEVEHRVVWPDGTVRWLLERGAVTRDAAGQPNRMLGVVQDIHERKQVELALVESEKRLREAQALARLGHWQTNIAMGELYWSEEIYRIFGHDSATFTPSVAAFEAAVHPDDRTRVADSEKRAEHTGVHDVVHRIVRPDGTVRHVHEQARAERGADGQMLRLTGTVQDMTEYMEAKEQLRESEERFVFAVEGAGDGIWDWRLPTGVMTLSGHYEAMLGYRKGDLTPTIEAWTASVHPDDLPQVQRQLQDYLAGKVAVYVVELRLRCKDGGYKWVLCRGTVVARDGQQMPLRMIGIHSDISAQKVAQAALVDARETAERANQAKSDFLSSMSHELRTPMNAILGFAQIMQYDSTLPAEHLDNVQEILKGGHHLLALINEVLELAKIESGTVDLLLEPVMLAGLVADCQSLIQPLAGARRITLRMAVPSDATVFADPMRLKQALLNLLSNAVKYNRAGGDVHVDVQAVAPQRLRLTVTDSGVGIAPEHMALLFQPFSRLGAEHGSIEGTGIGLTITRRLVEMMGGAMGVDSQVGVGSAFWIELPSSAMTTHDAPVAAAAMALHVGASTQLRRVLCIDDNLVNLNLIIKLLGMRPNIDLLTAHTPGLGIELALAHRPELILLDINMPGLDGYQVLEVFRADPDLKTIPVIAITANAMQRDLERGRVAGFAGYLTKPLDVNEFLKTLDRCLNRSEENAE